MQEVIERYPDLDELLPDDFEFRPILTGGDTVGGGVYRGREGWEAYRSEFADTWSALRIEIVQIHDRGAGIVAVESVLHGEGRISRAPVSMRVCLVFTLRDGALWRTTSYHSLDEAIAALEADLC